MEKKIAHNDKYLFRFFLCWHCELKKKWNKYGVIASHFLAGLFRMHINYKIN